MYKIPILFLVFNRPDTTEKVFARIKEIKPKHLYIAADGPRDNNFSDIEKCQATRTLIDKGIDWECNVQKLYRDTNLGCGKAVSEAITWFFENVEMGVILEDDCLPNFSFFSFCSKLLEKYKDNNQIMHISGNNFQDGIRRSFYSYYFSAYNHNWGWATWKRAWILYDYFMYELDDFITNNKIKKYFYNEHISSYWIRNLLKVKNRTIDTWDYQWTFCVWKHNGLSIIPNKNLVSNIGFREDATHTKKNSKFSNIETHNINRVIHPFSINQNRNADEYYSKKLLKQDTSKFRIKISKIKSIIRNIKYVDIVYNKIKQREEKKKYLFLYSLFKDYTMIPKDIFIHNLKLATKITNTKGEIVECGVWRGGMIGAICKLLNDNRTYHLFDSFEGLPKVKDIDGHKAKTWQENTTGNDYFNNCKAEISYAHEAMNIASSKNYKIYKGWFEKTVDNFKDNNQIALLRLDADWYDSTIQCLEKFFPLVIDNGLVIIDDYYKWEGCAKAVHDYLAKYKLPYRICSEFNNKIAYIIKNK